MEYSHAIWTTRVKIPNTQDNGNANRALCPLLNAERDNILTTRYLNSCSYLVLIDYIDYYYTRGNREYLLSETGSPGPGRSKKTARRGTKTPRTAINSAGGKQRPKYYI